MELTHIIILMHVLKIDILTVFLINCYCLSKFYEKCEVLKVSHFWLKVSNHNADDFGVNNTRFQEKFLVKNTRTASWIGLLNLLEFGKFVAQKKCLLCYVIHLHLCWNFKLPDWCEQRRHAKSIFANNCKLICFGCKPWLQDIYCRQDTS